MDGTNVQFHETNQPTSQAVYQSINRSILQHTWNMASRFYSGTGTLRDLASNPIHHFVWQRSSEANRDGNMRTGDVYDQLIQYEMPSSFFKQINHYGITLSISHTTSHSCNYLFTSLFIVCVWGGEKEQGKESTIERSSPVTTERVIRNFLDQK